MSGAHASPRAGRAVALRARRNPTRQLRMLAAREVLGSAGWVEGHVERINELQFAEHRETWPVLCHLGVCSVSPIAPKMLLCSLLTFWGWISPRLLPKENESLSLLLALSALQSERDFSFPFCRTCVFSASLFVIFVLPHLSHE